MGLNLIMSITTHRNIVTYISRSSSSLVVPASDSPVARHTSSNPICRLPWSLKLRPFHPMCEIFWGSKCTPKKLASHDLVNVSYYFHQYPLCYLFPKMFSGQIGSTSLTCDPIYPPCACSLTFQAASRTHLHLRACKHVLEHATSCDKVPSLEEFLWLSLWTAGIMLPLRPLTQPHLVSRMSRISGKGPGTNKCWRNETLSKHLEAP